MLISPYSGKRQLKPQPSEFSIDWSHQLSQDLLLWYPFNEGRGLDVIDYSVNRLTRTLTNMSSSTSWVGGRDGVALFFDNSNDRLTVGSATVIDNIFDTGASVSVWINTNSGTNSRIVDKTGWLFLPLETLSGTCNIRLTHQFSTTNGHWTTTARPITFGQWHHVVVTYNNSSTANDAIIYVDGVPAAISETSTPAGTRVSDASGSFVIGDRLSTGRTFDGSMSDFRVYDRILSDVEVMSLYTDPWANIHPNRTLFLPDQAAGWTGIVNGVTNPAKVNGVAVANINKVNGVA